MNDNALTSASHAVYTLRLHIVFVTKYRRHTLIPELLDALRDVFTAILADWRCALIEFGGEADHVHLLVGIHPALNISSLINNLQSATARRMRNRFANHLAKFYWKPCFWHRAYYVGSVGGASLETVNATSKPKARKKNPERRPRGRPSWLAFA